MLFICASLSTISAKTPRTDGPAGSEYGPKQWLDGDLQIGAHFGVVLDQDESDENSVLVGGDIDYRPFELFGARLTALQSLQSPRSTLVNITPLLHFNFSNLSPYVMAGPGIAIVNAGGTSAKFSVAFGGGADFMFGERFGLGMLYNYVTIFDASDAHTLSARFFIRFPGDPY